MALGPNSDIHAHCIYSDPRERNTAARTMQNKETQIAITSWHFHCEPEAISIVPTFLEGVTGELEGWPRSPLRQQSEPSCRSHQRETF